MIGLEAILDDGGDEVSLFARTLALLPGDPKAAALARAQAFADAAMLLHRRLLPGRGFRLGETASGKGFGASWHVGDAHALTFEAATPGLALLRAIAHATRQRRETDIREACARCGGLGWVIANDGRKRLCPHPLRPVLPRCPS